MSLFLYFFSLTSAHQTSFTFWLYSSSIPKKNFPQLSYSTYTVLHRHISLFVLSYMLAQHFLLKYQLFTHIWLLYAILYLRTSLIVCSISIWLFVGIFPISLSLCLCLTHFLCVLGWSLLDVFILLLVTHLTLIQTTKISNCALEIEIFAENAYFIGQTSMVFIFWLSLSVISNYKIVSPKIQIATMTIPVVLCMLP